MIRTAFLPAFSAFCALSSAALAVPVAVNIDINRLSSNATYEGDDGALSAEGGTFWNAVPALVQSQNGIENLKDEAGRVTAVRYSVPRYAAGSQSGGNALFDSGLGWCCDLDAPISRVSGLVAGRTYDLCVYAPLNGTADLTVTHAGGQIAREVTGFSTAFAPSFVMPGTEGTDYHLFTGIQPYDTGGGNYGFDVSFLPQEGSSTYFAGLQIRGEIEALPSIADWRTEHFDTPDNAGDAADGEDPDKDGLTNIEEYLGCRDPNRADAAGYLTLRRDGFWLLVEFPRKLAVADAESWIEWSPDGMTWLRSGQTAPGIDEPKIFFEEEVGVEDGLATMSVRIASGLNPAVFVRLATRAK